jgi:hypothetical protein
MRVLVGPRVDSPSGGVLAVFIERLAGAEGEIEPLGKLGVGNLSRRLSAAEVHLLRVAMLGGEPEKHLDARRLRRDGWDGLVGYVCRGTDPTGAGAAAGVARVVAVTDHINLTWRSPLIGPNDDRLGPRFPTMTGVYAPEIVSGCGQSDEGMMVLSGVVAEVLDAAAPTAFEAEVARTQGCAAVSSELAPVVIVAAHLGLRVAAAVVMA